MVTTVNGEIVPDEPQVETKRSLSDHAIALRESCVGDGMLFQGWPVPTDARTMAFVQGLNFKAQADAAFTGKLQVSNWPIAFIDLSNAQILQLGDAMVDKIASVFEATRQCGEGINAGTITTKQEVDAIFASVVQRVFN